MSPQDGEFSTPAGHSSAELFDQAHALEAAGDVDGAMAAFRQGMNADDSPYMSACAINFGSRLIGQGDAAGGLAAFRHALTSQYTDHSALANYNSGRTAEQLGDIGAALTSYEHAVATHHPDYAPRAGLELARLRAAQGDTEQANAAYQAVLDYPESGAAAEAGYHLGTALKTSGDIVGATEAFRRGLDAFDSLHRSYCGIQLGLLFAKQGDDAGALAVTLRALESEHADRNAVGVASRNAGVFALRTGDIRLAIAAYRQAIEFQQPPESTQVLSQLRDLFGVGESRTIELEGFTGGEQQASYGTAVMALSDVASCTLAMTVTYGAIGSGKTGSDGVIALTSASATGSDLVFRWVSKSTDGAQFRELADYVVRTIGPYVAERMVPFVMDGDGVRFGGVAMSAAGIAIATGFRGKKVDILAWQDYAGCNWSSFDVRIFRRDPNGGKAKKFTIVSRNTPNAYVLPALLNVAATGFKNRPAQSRPPGV